MLNHCFQVQTCPVPPLLSHSLTTSSLPSSTSASLRQAKCFRAVILNQHLHGQQHEDFKSSAAKGSACHTLNNCLRCSFSFKTLREKDDASDLHRAGCVKMYRFFDRALISHQHYVNDFPVFLSRVTRGCCCHVSRFIAYDRGRILRLPGRAPAVH